jgi:hypothetical protein
MLGLVAVPLLIGLWIYAAVVIDRWTLNRNDCYAGAAARSRRRRVRDILRER